MLLSLPPVLSGFFFILAVYFPTVTSLTHHHPHLLFAIYFVLSMGLMPIILIGVWPFSPFLQAQTDVGF